MQRVSIKIEKNIIFLAQKYSRFISKSWYVHDIENQHPKKVIHKSF